MELLLGHINAWLPTFVAFFTHFFSGLGRPEVRRAAQSYMQGLMMPLERKTCWQVAEATGQRDPQAHQRMLRKARWDHALLATRRRHHIVEHCTRDEGLFILDETGFIKSGKQSVGVCRQYTGTTGKIDNCQSAVYGVWAVGDEHVLYDTRIYLPKEWCGDAERRERAGVPETIDFAPKTELALQLVDQALEDGLPIRWVAADAVYGRSFEVRDHLIAHGLHFVMGVPRSTKVHRFRPIELHPSGRRWPPRTGRIKFKPTRREPLVTVETLVNGLAADEWERVEVELGEKGPRVYDWAMMPVYSHRFGRPAQTLWLLVRRSPKKPKELAYYLCAAPRKTPLLTLAKVALGRWRIEESFAHTKELLGLDHYQVRGWQPWHRHMELCMLAQLFLHLRRRELPASDEGDRFTLPEVRRLIGIVLNPARSPTHRIRWSIWRRSHNLRAKHSHYRTRLGAAEEK